MKASKLLQNTFQAMLIVDIKHDICMFMVIDPRAISAVKFCVSTPLTACTFA